MFTVDARDSASSSFRGRMLEKLWTRHELKAAQARAFADAAEYILPARFDDTEIPGLLGTVAYVDLRSKTPETLATLVKSKVDRSKVARNCA